MLQAETEDEIGGHLSGEKSMNKSRETIAIDALNRRLVDAYRAKDIDAIMSAYATETSLIVFDLMPPSRYVGAEAFRTVFENYFKAFPGPVVIEAGDLSVEVCGTLGYSYKIDRWTIP
jgi:ketosteroid isomerase-like protein